MESKMILQPEILMLTGVFLVILNVLLVKYFMNHLKEKKIELVKTSLTGEKMRDVVTEWMKKVKLDYLPDGRLKVSFSSTSFSIFFYIQEQNNGIIISDHGEFMKKIDLTRTSNKNLVDKLQATCNLQWNGSDIYLFSTLSNLDEDIWNMFSCMVTLENVCY